MTWVFIKILTYMSKLNVQIKIWVGEGAIIEIKHASMTLLYRRNPIWKLCSYVTNKLAWSVWKIYVWSLVGTKTFFLTKKFPSILFMQIVFNAFNRNFTYTLTLSLLKQRHFLDCNRKTNPFLIHAVLDF